MKHPFHFKAQAIAEYLSNKKNFNLPRAKSPLLWQASL